MDDQFLQAQYLTAIATVLLAVGTFALAIVAVFQQAIWARLRCPTLRVTASTAPPDSHKTSIRAEMAVWGPVHADCYYLRLRVANTGNAPATNVELMASELQRREGDGSWARVEHFLPLCLTWSHVGGSIMPMIQRGTDKLCDLGHALDPQARSRFARDNPPQDAIERDPSLAAKVCLSLDTEVAPFTFSHILAPGTYRLALVLAATEIAPVRRTLEIGINGVWHDTESIMLGDLLTMRIVD